MEVGPADQPGDLRERGREGVAVDRDPAVAGPGALDDLGAAILEDRPALRGQRGLEDLQVDRPVGDERPVRSSASGRAVP